MAYKSKIAMQRLVSTVNVCSLCVCLLYVYILWEFCQWCMHSWSCCCRGFVEAYRDLLELVCEAYNVTLGSEVVIVNGIHGD